MVTYSYAIHCIKSNGVCFTYYRLLWVMILHSNNLSSRYRVVQKNDTQFYFWDNFGNSASILTILSLLQAEIYDA